MRFFTQVTIIIFVLAGLLFFVLVQIIDMAGRVDYVRAKWPKLLKWAEHRAWHGILLLVSALLLVGNIYEIASDEPLIVRPRIGSADPGAKDAQILELQAELTASKHPHSFQGKQSLDLRCQHLADCPSEELSKRANEWADRIAGILNDFERNVRPLPGNDDKQAGERYSDIYRGRQVLAIRSYQRMQSDVTAIRDVIRNRIGEHDARKESAYAFAGGEHSGTIQNLEEIEADLRELAGKVLATRQ